MRHASAAKAGMIFGVAMYGLKPVPFKLKPAAFALKPVLFELLR